MRRPARWTRTQGAQGAQVARPVNARGEASRAEGRARRANDPATGGDNGLGTERKATTGAYSASRLRQTIFIGLMLAGVMLVALVWMRGVGPETAGDGSSGRWSAMFLDVLRWIQGRGMMAALWLAALQALIVILAIPGPYFTLGAGFLFGLAGGSLTAVAGSTAGAVAAYGIARGARAVSEARAAKDHTASPRGAVPHQPRGGRFACWLAAHPRMQAAERLMMHLMRHGDWKVVLSTRLVPLFPFKVSNYAFGWVRYPFAAFFWGTALGLVPITMVSVSIGALASDMSGLTHPDLASGTSWAWSLAALAAGAGILVWTGRTAMTGARASSRVAEDGQVPNAERKS